MYVLTIPTTPLCLLVSTAIHTLPFNFKQIFFILVRYYIVSTCMCNRMYESESEV